MSSAKKLRELNRAIEEHDKAKLSAQFAIGNHSMLNIAESVLAKEIESLTAKVKSIEAENMHLKSFVGTEPFRAQAVSSQSLPTSPGGGDDSTGMYHERDKCMDCLRDDKNTLVQQLLAEQSKVKVLTDAIDAHLNPCGCANGCAFCNTKMTLEEALATVKDMK